MRPAVLLLFALGLGVAGWTELAGRKPWPVPAPAKAKKNPVPASAESIAVGRKLYRGHCLICHGARGHGDGPWVSKLPDPPANLADPGVLAPMTDGEIFWKISQGRDFMPGYEGKLSVAERWHVVNYLRTLVQPPRKGTH